MLLNKVLLFVLPLCPALTLATKNYKIWSLSKIFKICKNKNIKYTLSLVTTEPWPYYNDITHVCTSLRYYIMYIVRSVFRDKLKFCGRPSRTRPRVLWPRYSVTRVYQGRSIIWARARENIACACGEWGVRARLSSPGYT